MQRASELSADALWGDISSRLRDALNDTTYSTWFSDAEPGSLDGQSFVLFVPNDFTRDWIEGHFRGLLEAIVRDTTGDDRDVRIVVKEIPSSTPAVAHELRAPAAARQVPGWFQSEIHI